MPPSLLTSLVSPSLLLAPPTTTLPLNTVGVLAATTPPTPALDADFSMPTAVVGCNSVAATSNTNPNTTGCIIAVALFPLAIDDDDDDDRQNLLRSRPPLTTTADAAVFFNCCCFCCCSLWRLFLFSFIVTTTPPPAAPAPATLSRGRRGTYFVIFFFTPRRSFRAGAEKTFTVSCYYCPDDFENSLQGEFFPCYNTLFFSSSIPFMGDTFTFMIASTSSSLHQPQPQNVFFSVFFAADVLPVQHLILLGHSPGPERPDSCGGGTRVVHSAQIRASKQQHFFHHIFFSAYLYLNQHIANFAARNWRR